MSWIKFVLAGAVIFGAVLIVKGCLLWQRHIIFENAKAAVEEALRDPEARERAGIPATFRLRPDDYERYVDWEFGSYRVRFRDERTLLEVWETPQTYLPFVELSVTREGWKVYDIVYWECEPGVPLRPAER